MMKGMVSTIDDRPHLEYSRFKGLITEIQVRTILQHAWAEIEHDIQYKSLDTIPNSIRRRFMSLAGMLEIGDREFQAIQDEDASIRRQARLSVQQGKFEQVEITPDALRAYLDRKLCSDDRISDYSYEWTARLLRVFGFTDFRQVDECIAGYDDDALSRAVWGARQGQITRFELMLQASMGENYKRFHFWHGEEWFPKRCDDTLAAIHKGEFPVGSYLPPNRRIPEPPTPPYSGPNARSPQG
jgi:putative GTP pyrophosphokinase